MKISVSSAASSGTIEADSVVPIVIFLPCAESPGSPTDVRPDLSALCKIYHWHWRAILPILATACIVLVVVLTRNPVQPLSQIWRRTPLAHCFLAVTMAENCVVSVVNDGAAYASADQIPDDLFDFVEADGEPVIVITVGIYMSVTKGNKVMLFRIVTDADRPIESVNVMGEAYDINQNWQIHSSQYKLNTRPRRIIIEQTGLTLWTEDGIRRTRDLDVVAMPRVIEVPDPFEGDTFVETICELGAGEVMELLTDQKLSITFVGADGQQRLAHQAEIYKPVIAEEVSVENSELVLASNGTKSSSSAKKEDEVASERHDENG
ncbi:uncharacterized protein LOC135827042 isoform X1 [Sycon ciliatum]|uniref:uncharacterized protein LOC135827009 isoform X1 n=2 Tax=Sycon ciliatum TaxID=27933 RepID=UPI0031F62DFB